MAQTMYEIRVAGTVPEAELQDMGAVPVEPAPVNTVLYGVSDQAALYGLLDRLRALGIVVLEVRRVQSPAVEPDERDEERPDVGRTTDSVGGYQVALPASFGPAFLAAFADMGVSQATTTSVFLVSVPDSLGIHDLTAMLNEHGLTILGIRRVTAFTPQG